MIKIRKFSGLVIFFFPQFFRRPFSQIFRCSKFLTFSAAVIFYRGTLRRAVGAKEEVEDHQTLKLGDLDVQISSGYSVMGGRRYEDEVRSTIKPTIESTSSLPAVKLSEMTCLQLTKQPQKQTSSHFNALDQRTEVTCHCSSF